MTTLITRSPATTRRNAALVVARCFAGLLGSAQLAGAAYFGFVAPEEAVWRGPAIDVPVVGLLFASILLKLATAVGPGLSAHRRIATGLVAVAIGVAVTLVKIPLYDEPEGVTFLALDAVLVGLLLMARRGAGPGRTA